MPKAPSKPKVDDLFTLDGKSYAIAAITGGRVTLEDEKNPALGHVTLSLADVEWNEEADAWSLPGRAAAPARSATATLRRGPAPKEK